MSKNHTDKRGRLLDLAGRTKTPIAADHQKMKDADVDSSDFDVMSNGLWLARWSGATLMLLVLSESTPQTVLAAPVTIEPGLLDQEAVVLDSSTNPLGLPITVWLGITREVPIQTLERRLGELPAQALDTAKSTTRAAALTAIDQGTSPWLFPSAEKKAEMEDTLECWLTELKPLPFATIDSGPTHEKPPFTLHQVMEALNIPQRKAMNFLRGTFQLSPAETEQLALHTGVPPEAVSSLAAQLPNELLIEVQQPRWRFLVQSEARKIGTDESEAQLTVAREAYALAARQKGNGTNVWRQRLRTIALAHLSRGTSEER
ncbi:hypothetical protein J2790_000110 [Paenarthrobacter nicotinovorans]|uniref:hypothetical protein n=1 Tax=Micrococcaceae TaxID=1268 RepID=UPI0008769209|nr:MULTISPECIES: hypothetical protein [Micrococcaceae]MDR6434989.1 hypothetical protein [Paenarthrobacter nicotinovorans]SCZ59156.1 hypothetical protein SAMN02799638_02662 [Arthrobacter sp. UNCCL28]